MSLFFVPRRPTRSAALACVAAATLLAGCGGGGDGAGGRPIVAATAPQIDGLLRELAGPGIDVAAVVTATADVHEIELRPSQARALRTADLIVRPGRENDVWAQEALQQVGGKQLDVSAGLPGTQRHWWMDPTLVEAAAASLSTALDRLDPDGKASRAKRLRAFVTDLRHIDGHTRACLATVPPSRRLIVTDHDAAGAYASRYGLTVVGTISPGAEPEAAPSAQRITQLERTMLARHVAALFPIAPHGSELSATIAQRGGAKLGKPLWADALPPANEALQPSLQRAAILNGAAVASALGGAGSVCADLVDAGDENG